MTYEETIEWLYKQLPMFSRIGIAAYKKDLHNTITLCNYLDDPHQKFKSIHVAGTNGKGSTSHMIAAILQEAGYKTGLYTSPHIKDFRERIRINGGMVDKGFVIDFVSRTKTISEKINPSFFELTVAMAFDYFANNKVDIAVIETGLGGRLDSTNVIAPILSVITNIGYDHTNMLGTTLREIATEKAGIIKVNTPVVIGEVLPETFPVFKKKAAEMNAGMHLASEKFIVKKTDAQGTLLVCDILNVKTGSVEKYRLDLTGLYQAKNICTVLGMVELLNANGFSISKRSLSKGLENVRVNTGLRGRWDILQKDPTIILDVAHNEDGINQVLQQIKINYPSSAIHFILGFVNDKDIDKLLTLFPVSAKYYFTNAHIPRALSYQALKQSAAIHLLEGDGYDDINDAIDAAKRNATKNDVIMVCGSFFIIAEIE